MMSPPLFGLPEVSAEVHIKLSPVDVTKNKGKIFFPCKLCPNQPALSNFQNYISHRVLNHSHTYSIYCGKCCASYNVADFSAHINDHISDAGKVAKLEDSDWNDPLDSDDFCGDEVLSFLSSVEGLRNEADVKLEEEDKFSQETTKKINESFSKKEVPTRKRYNTRNRSKEENKIAENECEWYVAKNSSSKRKEKKRTKGSRFEKFECDFCGRIVQGKAPLRSHMYTHVNANKYKCTCCSEGFPFRCLLQKHRERHKNEKPVNCPHCSARYKTQRLLVAHLARAHKIGENFECDFCKKKLAFKQSLGLHIKYLHLHIQQRLCALCGLDFKGSVQLRNHMKVHSSKNGDEKVKRLMKYRSVREVNRCKAFPCSYCKKRFWTETSRDRHALRHTNPKRHKCPKCPQGFPSIEALKKHITSVHGELQCHVCSKKIKNYQNYVVHVQRHEGIVNYYKCEKCDKVFNSRNVWRNHKVVHTDDRPHKCTMCDRSFKLRSVLKDHINVHSGQPSRFAMYRKKKQPSSSNDIQPLL